MKSFWQLSLVAVCVLAEPAFAQKLVDPNAVAPQYREAAEKRRTEQIRQMECRHKVDAAKVLPRIGRRRSINAWKMVPIRRRLPSVSSRRPRRPSRNVHSQGSLTRFTRKVHSQGSLERLFGLNREANGYFGRAVEDLEQMVAKQATILAFWSPYGNEFNPAVTGIALGAGDIGLLHGRHAITPRLPFQYGGPASPAIEFCLVRLAGGGRAAPREPADHGFDLGYHEVRRGVFKIMWPTCGNTISLASFTAFANGREWMLVVTVLSTSPKSPPPAP